MKMDAQLSSKSLRSEKPSPSLTHLNCSTRTRFGPITLDRGAVYEGDWLMGLRDGYGIQKWSDGSMYKQPRLALDMKVIGRRIRVAGRVN
jgi:hypothetical protein